MAGDFTLNVQGMIDLTNEVNEQVCKSLAEHVADRARSLAEEFTITGDYRDSIHVVTDPRDSWTDWAHSRVVADSDHALQVESRHGTLAKALGEQ